MGQQISTNPPVTGYISDRQYRTAHPMVDINSFADFSFYPDKYAGQRLPGHRPVGHRPPGRAIGQSSRRPVHNDQRTGWTGQTNTGWTGQTNTRWSGQTNTEWSGHSASLSVPATTTNWSGHMADTFESHSLPATAVSQTGVDIADRITPSPELRSTPPPVSPAALRGSPPPAPRSPDRRQSSSPPEYPCKPATIQRQFSDFNFYPDRFDYAPKSTGRC